MLNFFCFAIFFERHPDFAIFFSPKAIYVRHIAIFVAQKAKNILTEHKKYYIL